MKDQHPSKVLGVLEFVGNARFSHNQIGDCGKGKHTAQWPSTMFSAALFVPCSIQLTFGYLRTPALITTLSIFKFGCIASWATNFWVVLVYSTLDRRYSMSACTYLYALLGQDIAVVHLAPAVVAPRLSPQPTGMSRPRPPYSCDDALIFG